MMNMKQKMLPISLDNIYLSMSLCHPLTRTQKSVNLKKMYSV